MSSEVIERGWLVEDTGRCDAATEVGPSGVNPSPSDDSDWSWPPVPQSGVRKLGKSCVVKCDMGASAGLWWGGAANGT